MQNCIFCKIVSGEVPAHRVWEDENFLAFLDIKPINPGHVLVIPQKHAGYIFDLPDDEYAALFAAAKFLAGPLRRATGTARIAIGVEGFEVDHVHVSLIPLNGSGELDPRRATPASDADLAEMASRVKVAIGLG